MSHFLELSPAVAHGDGAGRSFGLVALPTAEPGDDPRQGRADLLREPADGGDERRDVRAVVQLLGVT